MTVRPLRVERSCSCPSVPSRLKGGQFSPGRWEVAPSSVGAGMVDQSGAAPQSRGEGFSTDLGSCTRALGIAV